MHYAPFAAEPALDAPNLDIPFYFETIDGLPVAHEEAEAALRSGQAVLVGTLLVSVFMSF